MLTVGELLSVLFQFLIDFLGVVLIFLFLLMFGAGMVGMYKSIRNLFARRKDRTPEYEKAKDEIRARVRRMKERQAAMSDKDDILLQKYEELRNDFN